MTRVPQVDLNTAYELSVEVEKRLVALDLRGMAALRSGLKPGYCMRSALHLLEAQGPVLITTGFPVGETFETDGPVGAIQLYRVLERLNSEPSLLVDPHLASALGASYRTHQFAVGERDPRVRVERAQTLLSQIKPALVISVESPGMHGDGEFYNMRSQSISSRVLGVDEVFELAQCPTIAIGDGGNEVGMGNLSAYHAQLDLKPAVTRSDELILADISNWGAHALGAFSGWMIGQDLYAGYKNSLELEQLSSYGGLDGVTGRNLPTEDGRVASEGDQLIESIRALFGFEGI